MNTNTPKWYTHQDSYDDVVVFSEVGLARNLAEFDFRDKIGNDDAARLVEKVRALTKELAGGECEEYYSCNVNRLPEIERNILIEQHAISPELACKKQDTGLIISEDESVSIMINEEDHILITSRAAGSNIRKAWKNADRIDNYIDSKLRYAYSDRYGYLTTCMSDVGTGMHCSYILSLPALAMSGKFDSIRDEVSKIGAVMKDVYSEENKTRCFMFRITNQRTLGCSEPEIIENLDQVVGQIVALERKRRAAWIENERDEVEDKVYRSYGVLQHTRLITCKDAMMLLAQLKLGADIGLINLSGNGADLHRLMMEIQPACIAKRYKCSNDAKAVNKARATYLNEMLPKLH